SVYVEVGAAGIVTVRPPAGVDWALPTRLVPPEFVRVRLYMVLGVKPVPSKTTSAELVSWKATLEAENAVGRRFAIDPDQEACNVWLSTASPMSYRIVPPTVAETFSARPVQARAMRVAAVRVASFWAVRSDVRIPGPAVMTFSWMFAGRRIAVLGSP